MKEKGSMVKKIPLSLIINEFKGETIADGRVNLDVWLKEDESHGDVYLALKSLWNALMLEGMNYKSAADELWKRQDEMCSGKPAAKEVRFSRRKFRWAIAAASVLLAIVMSFGWRLIKEMRETSMVTQHYSAVVGKSKVILPDGSTVWLNSGTTLEYKSKAWRRQRYVSLNGEACFDVVHDERKPFVVESNGVSVTVHGTKFNVSAYDEDEDVKVSLINGQVSIRSSLWHYDMTAGDEALCNKENGRLSIEKSDVDFAALWAKEYIRFERKPISFVARHLSKWYGVDIAIDKNVPDNQAYTFVVKKESLDEILRLMARISPIRYDYGEDNTVNIYNIN